MGKEFIKELKMKKMKVGEVAEIIADNQKDFVEFYITQAHKMKNAEVVKELHEKMFNEKFVKALNKIIKVAKKENSDGLDVGFVTIIADFIEKNRNDERLTDEIKDAYTEIINNLLKKRSKKIADKVGIDKDIVKELLVITPDVGYISNDNFVGIYSQKMLRKLYYIAEKNDIGLTETKQVNKLFEKLFGKNLLDLIAINILLEKQESIKNFNDSQKNIWNLMTNFALEVIENQEKKKHITELIEYYCSRRKRDAAKERDAARRINLTTISEDYPRFAKAITKFKEDGESSLVKYL